MTVRLHIVSSLLANPYHYSAAIFARVTVLIASMLWGALVFLTANALSSFPAYRDMILVAPENVWASALLLACGVSLVRLWRHCRPHWIGGGLYALVMFFWFYVLYATVSAPLPLPPGAFSCISTIALVSVYAFVANPKRPTDAPSC